MKGRERIEMLFLLRPRLVDVRCGLPQAMKGKKDGYPFVTKEGSSEKIICPRREAPTIPKGRREKWTSLRKEESKERGVLSRTRSEEAFSTRTI